MSQVFEQIDDETAQILSLLRELLDERERAGGVAIDDEIAQAEERLLLHGAEELQDRLDRDLLLRRRSELVERRLGVAIRAPAASGDQRQCLVGHVDPLAVGDAAELAHELGQARPLKDKRLTAG